MNPRRLTLWLATLVAVAGLAGIAARVISDQPGTLDSDQSIWRLNYDIHGRGADWGTKTRIFLPQDSAHCRPVRESFTHSGLRVAILQAENGRQRSIVAVPVSTTKAARLTVDIHVQANSSTRAGLESPEPLSPEERARYLQANKNIPVGSQEVIETVRELVAEGGTRREVIEAIFEFCWQELALDSSGGPSDVKGVLLAGRASSLGRARAMVTLCRAADLPARVVRGVVLRNDGNAVLHAWAEVHVGQRWVPYDPEYGLSGEVGANYLVVCRDGGEVTRSLGAPGPQTRISVQRIAKSPVAGSRRSAGILAVLDLTRLPVGMQHTLAVLLLLPLGALITAAFRNLVGLETFGTFTPALLALSFVYADWLTGVLIFLSVIAIGLASRSVLGKLQLLVVPRLGAILTLVLLSLVMSVSVLDHFSLTPSARAVILPMVVLTMMIERFHVRAEEDSPLAALRLMAFTFLIAACCLVVLRWEMLGRLAVRFPEGNLIVLATLLLVGRYSGYRLTELIRFRDLARRGGEGA